MLLGIVIGLLIAILCLLIEIRFNFKASEEIVITGKPYIAPKGFVVQAPSEEGELLDQLFAKNSAEGKDTRIEELE
jgi:hypothetical protein